jgi:uncharacterized protein YndB with AHSA1/START domain
MNIVQDPSNKALHITRAFKAPLQKVWKAWTDPKILDQWWAPGPWKNTTHHMDFREGGYWLYSMTGPSGDKHYCKGDFESILFEDSIKYLCHFCDEEGNNNPDFPPMHWTIHFLPKDERSSSIEVTLTMPDPNGLKMLVEQGFKEGFTMGLENLDRVLASQEAQPA